MTDPPTEHLRRSPRRLHPGDHFGEIALMEGARTASVTAEMELRCYGMSSWEFRKLAETYAASSWRLASH